MVYLDASFVVPILVPEPSSSKVEKALAAFAHDTLALSLWTKLECVSVVARLVRMRLLTAGHAERIRSTLDRLIESSLRVLVPGRDDFAAATELIAESDWQLRGPDALHLAIARNHGVERMLTLDAGLAKIAKRLGIPASGLGA